MARTQKNKATAGHLGMLKAKLAKLRRELITPKSGGGGGEMGFEVNLQALFHSYQFYNNSIFRLQKPVMLELVL